MRGTSVIFNRQRLKKRTSRRPIADQHIHGTGQHQYFHQQSFHLVQSLNFRGKKPMRAVVGYPENENGGVIVMSFSGQIIM